MDWLDWLDVLIKGAAVIVMVLMAFCALVVDNIEPPSTKVDRS